MDWANRIDNIEQARTIIRKLRDEREELVSMLGDLVGHYANTDRQIAGYVDAGPPRSTSPAGRARRRATVPA